MNRVARSLIIVIILCRGTVKAVDFETPTIPGLGGCAVMMQPSASDFLLTTGASLGSRSFAVDLLDYDQFQMQEFHQNAAAIAYRSGRYAVAAGLTQFGMDGLYREMAYQIAVSRQIRRFAFGVNSRVTSIEFGEFYSPLSMTAFGLGAACKLRSAIVSVNLEDINSPRPGNTSARLNPKLSGYLEYWPRESYSVTSRFTAQKGQKLQVGFGQILKLPLQSRLFWGLSTEPLIYGAGLEIFVYKAFITCTASYHPALGLSRMITLSFRGDREK